METQFVCPTCGNKDPLYIGHLHGKPYCRKCITFRGEEAEIVDKKPKNVVLDLKYSLSKEQKEISVALIKNYWAGIDTLVYAVCGSGKTEISFGIIGECAAKGLRVGFAVPRRDVAMELYWRLKSAFPHNNVIAVYGGHTETKAGDIIVLTTHQLYRYSNYFDLLVMDEIDAFPFKGSDVLNAMYQRSLSGHAVLMSATPSKKILKEFSKPGHAILELQVRFHHKPIPVPEIIVAPFFLKAFVLLKRVREFGKRGKPCFVFVPTIELARMIYRFLSLFLDGGNFVSSKRKKRVEIIEAFREGRYKYLVTTAVLERGVTVKGIQVIVYGADSPIYDSASLIQISGRVGRKAGETSGSVIFLGDKRTPQMEEAIRTIKKSNLVLQNMLQGNKAQ